MVGLGRIELPTSRLSGVRSSHLSYRPSRDPQPGNLTTSAVSATDRRDHTTARHSSSQVMEVY